MYGLCLFLTAILQFAKEFLVSTVVRVSITTTEAKDKPVSTIFIHNLEMKSPIVFCLAEVSDCSALIEVLLLFTEGHRSVTPTFPLPDFLLSISVFPCRIPSLTFY